MKYSLLARSLLVIWLIVGGLTATGCGIAKTFDQAIEEVRNLRLSIERESSRWRDALDNAQMKLTADVKEIINVDVRDAIDRSIASVGIEARCEGEFINNNLKTWLLGVEEAIKKKKKEFLESPVRATLSPETMIHDAIAHAPPIEPKVCHVIPTAVTFEVSDKKPDRASIEFIGFALNELAINKFSLVLHGPERPKEGLPIPNSDVILIRSTSYKLAVDSTRITEHVFEA